MNSIILLTKEGWTTAFTSVKKLCDKYPSFNYNTLKNKKLPVEVDGYTIERRVTNLPFEESKLVMMLKSASFEVEGEIETSENKIVEFELCDDNFGFTVEVICTNIPDGPDPDEVSFKTMLTTEISQLEETEIEIGSIKNVKGQIVNVSVETFKLVEQKILCHVGR